MHMGNMSKDFVPVGKEEQAEVKNDTNAQKVATLLGIDCEWMINYFCKPKLKVGTEWYFLYIIWHSKLKIFTGYETVPPDT